MLDQLQKSDESRNAFLQKLAKWEEMKNAKDIPGARVQRRRHADCVKLKAQAVHSAEFALEEELGVFWPDSVYFREEKKKAAKKDLVAINHLGRTLRGVVRDPRHGCPIGCIRMRSSDKSAIQKVGEMVNNDSASGSEVEETFGKAVKRLQVKATVRDGKEFAKVQPKHENKCESDDEADDNIFDAIWGKRFMDKRQCDDPTATEDHYDDTVPPPPKRRTTTGSSSCTTPRGKASASSLGSPMAPPAPPTGRSKGATPPTRKAQAKELDVAEQVLLQYKQFRNALVEDNRILTLKPEVAESLKNKLAKRLTPELIAAYTLDADPATSSKGISVLADIRDAHRATQVAETVLRALAASPNDLEAAASLLDVACKEAKAASLPVAPKIQELLCGRFVSARIAAGNYAGAAKVLDPTNATESAGLNAVAAQDRLSVQQALVTKSIIDHLRATADDKLTELMKVRPFLAALLDGQIVREPEQFVQDITHLLTMLRFQDAASDEDIVAIEGAQKAMNARGDSPLHKPLTLFSSGSALMSKCSLLVEGMLTDRAVLAEKSALEMTVAALETPVISVEFPSGVCALAMGKQWADMHSKANSIESRLSERIRCQFALLLTKRSELQKRLVKSMKLAVGRIIDEKLQDVVAALEAFLDKSGPLAASSFDASVDLVRIALAAASSALAIDYRTVSFENFLPPELIVEFKMFVSAAASACKTLNDHARLLVNIGANGELDLESSQCIGIFNLFSPAGVSVEAEHMVQGQANIKVPVCDDSKSLRVLADFVRTNMAAKAKAQVENSIASFKDFALALASGEPAAKTFGKHTASKKPQHPPPLDLATSSLSE